MPRRRVAACNQSALANAQDRQRFNHTCPSAMLLAIRHMNYYLPFFSLSYVLSGTNFGYTRGIGAPAPRDRPISVHMTSCPAESSDLVSPQEPRKVPARVRLARRSALLPSKRVKRRG